MPSTPYVSPVSFKALNNIASSLARLHKPGDGPSLPLTPVYPTNSEIDILVYIYAFAFNAAFNEHNCASLVHGNIFTSSTHAQGIECFLAPRIILSPLCSFSFRSCNAISLFNNSYTVQSVSINT